MNLPLMLTINPLDWPSPVFVMLIVLAIVLRVVIPWRTHTSMRVVRELLVILPAVLLYFLIRGLAESNHDTAIRHGEYIISLERRLGIWWEPALQESILASGWRVDIVNWVYIWAHWPVIALVVSWLVLRHFDRYPQYRTALLLSGVIGMVIFVTYPVAPPRLMPGYGLIDTVTQQSNSYRVLQPPALTNPYAAMPSLHFGWNLLMGIALVREARSRHLRTIGFIIPIAMLLAIVLSANHYVLDAAAGGAIVLFSLAVAHPLSRLLTQPFAFWPRRKLEYDGHSLNFPDAGNAEQMLAVAGLVERPFIVAHRYGNSLSAVHRAERAGADIIEADIWPYRGRLEVRHTKTLGPVPVLWDRWSLERGWKPRLQLAELLAATAPETLLMLDVKGDDLGSAEAIMETVRAHRPHVPILVCSQNWNLVDQFRPHPEVARVYSIGNRRQLERSWERMEEDWDAVSIQYRLLDEEIVQALMARVDIVMTWPINNEERLEIVHRWGVDGFTSDNLELIAGFSKFTQNQSSVVDDLSSQARA